MNDSVAGYGSDSDDEMIDMRTGEFVPVSSQERLAQKEDKRIENMRRSVIILRKGGNGKNNDVDDSSE